MIAIPCIVYRSIPATFSRKTTISAQFITCTDWKLSENLTLQSTKRLRRPWVAGVALWHAPGGNFLNYVARHR